MEKRPRQLEGHLISVHFSVLSEGVLWTVATFFIHQVSIKRIATEDTEKH